MNEPNTNRRKIVKKTTKKNKHQWVVLTAIIKVTGKEQLACVKRAMKQKPPCFDMSEQDLAEISKLGIIEELRTFSDRLASRNKGAKCLLVKTTG